MKNVNHAIYFIEKITIFSFIRDIVPFFFLRKRFDGIAERTLYFFDASLLDLKVVQGLAKLGRLSIKRVEFEQYAIKDQKGDSIWLKLLFRDLKILQDRIRNSYDFQIVANSYKDKNKIPSFLSKRLMKLDSASQNTLLKLMFFMEIILQKCVFKFSEDSSICFFVKNRPWFKEIEEFAKEKKISLIPLHYFNIEDFFIRESQLKRFVKKIKYYWMIFKYKRRMIFSRESLVESSVNCKREFVQIAVEYYGHLNLKSHQMFSDLFFCQESELFLNNVLMYFNIPVSPLTDKKWNEIKALGMDGVAINYNAVAAPHIPVFKQKIKYKKTLDFEEDTYQIKSLNYKWLKSQVEDYYALRQYWLDFFSRYNIKLHVSWYDKFQADHFAKLDALSELGGVGAIYQRSFEEFSNPWMITSVDIFFSFSKLGAYFNKDTDSKIPYNVVTGYLGDHRFSLVKEQSNYIRQKMYAQGVNRILAYFDESSEDDGRWSISHKVAQEDYIFLLNKVLDNPWFGLILKPKVSATLRKRLGHVELLLKDAEKTGRCFIFEGGEVYNSYPPVIAALASDIAVQGHLFGGTAGVESALAGVPTLLLDREGLSSSILYRLGVGKCIFKTWSDLWMACMEIWKSDKKFIEQIDWSDILNELDPFRDGQAAQRMGTYLKWILDGLKDNLSKETVLADAAQQYADLWGKDKIFSVN